MFAIFAFEFESFMMKTVFFAIGFVALAVILLGVKVLFVKGGKFPSGHVHDIENRRRELREKNDNK